MNTLSTTGLTAYAAQRLAAGTAPASVDHDLALMRRAFRLAVRSGELVTMRHVPMLALDNVTSHRADNGHVRQFTRER